MRQSGYRLIIWKGITGVLSCLINLYSKPPAMLVWLNKATPRSAGLRRAMRENVYSCEWKIRTIDFWSDDNPLFREVVPKADPPWRKSNTGILSKERNMSLFSLVWTTSEPVPARMIVGLANGFIQAGRQGNQKVESSFRLRHLKE